ncbi:restriction endonuclease subunit S [Apilactobacillus sp. 1-1-2]|uniref:Type I restriction modification DNA specificity domain-containing protein n=1 Tax=Apilactobacillus kunkeei TaxID=148814 RepID=A0AAC8WAN7_9LACO|nr:restriction endonuclease subunit S [Apilactobacillus kunkeei]ALJ30805.1 hypothetical protein APS55_00485 [Apilactobacillus kunkeei]
MAYKNLPDLRFSGFSNNFKLLHIGDILKIKNGKSQKNVEVSEGKYPILGTGGIIGRTNSFLYDKESVLIGRKGTINKPMYMDTPFWTVDTLFYSEIKSNSDAKFVYFLFNTIEWLKYNTSTGVPSLTSTNIESIFVSIPEKIEQQKIGDFFTKLDKLIELQTQKVDQLKKLKRGYLQKMFPQEGETVPRLRFSGFSGEWKEESIEEIAPLETGYSFKSDKFISDGLPIIRISNILNNGNIGGDFKYYKESESLRKFVVNNGSILIAMSGATVGKISLLKKNGFYLNQRVGYFKTNVRYDNSFVYCLLKSNNYYKNMNSIKVAGAQPNISKSEINGFNFLLPNHEEQQKIGDFFAKLDKLIEEQSNKLNQLKQQKKAYLQKMFI